MKIFIILFITFIATNYFSIAQNSKDSIIIKEIFGGFEYYQNGNLLSMKNLKKAVTSNDEAFKLINSTQINNTLSQIIGFIGGGLVGYPIGTALAGGEANWTMAGIGAGLIAISIPLNNKYNNDVNKAVDIYNDKLLSDNFWDKSELKLTVNVNSIGLVLNF